jgi:hypothetical protein
MPDEVPPGPGAIHGDRPGQREGERPSEGEEGCVRRHRPLQPEEVPWCVSCQRELGKDDLTASKVCKRCENKPLLVEFCVKAGETEDRARVTYKCDSCAAVADVEADFKHEEDCKRKGLGGLKKVCSRSGMPPHATEAK